MASDGPFGANELRANIGNPARRALAHAEITSLDELARWTDADVADLHGIGPKALGILRTALRERGLGFAGETTAGER